jgi:hypothetical protein
MEMNPIDNHIDRKIIEFLDSQGWEIARGYLIDNVKNFSNQLLKNPRGNSRRQKLTQYIEHAKRRVIDLYYIQNEWSKFNYGPRKTFELLLLKEKLQS